MYGDEDVMPAVVWWWWWTVVNSVRPVQGRGGRFGRRVVVVVGGGGGMRGGRMPEDPWGRPARFSGSPVLAVSHRCRSGPSCRIEVPFPWWHCVTARRQRGVELLRELLPMSQCTCRSLSFPRKCPSFRVATALIMLRSPQILPSTAIPPKPRLPSCFLPVAWYRRSC